MAVLMKALMLTEDIAETAMMEDTEWMEIVTEDIPREKEDILTEVILIVATAEMSTERTNLKRKGKEKSFLFS